MDAHIPPMAFYGILALAVAVTARVTEKDVREGKLFRGRPWLLPLSHVPVVMAWLHAQLVETGSARVLSRSGAGRSSTSARADRSTFRSAPSQPAPRVLRHGVARPEGDAEFRHFGINPESGCAYLVASRSSTEREPTRAHCCLWRPWSKPRRGTVAGAFNSPSTAVPGSIDNCSPRSDRSLPPSTAEDSSKLVDSELSNGLRC